MTPSSPLPSLGESQVMSEDIPLPAMAESQREGDQSL
jgi:hypothetical protein